MENKLYSVFNNFSSLITYHDPQVQAYILLSQLTYSLNSVNSSYSLTQLYYTLREYHIRLLSSLATLSVLQVRNGLLPLVRRGPITCQSHQHSHCRKGHYIVFEILFIKIPTNITYPRYDLRMRVPVEIIQMRIFHLLSI